MPSRRTVLAGVSSLSTTALAGCLGDDSSFSAGTDENADWPMPRFDSANTAYSPDAKAPRESVQERWRVDVGMASGTPVVDDGTVFLPARKGLLALDGESGEELWRFAPSSNPWPNGPAVHDGLVFISMQDDDGVYALDTETGEVVWSAFEDQSVRAPVHLVTGEHVPEPMLYAGTEKGIVSRFVPATGQPTWQTDLFGTISAFGFRASVLCVGTKGGELYTYYHPGGHVDPEEEQWRNKVGSAVEGLLPTDEGVLVDTFGGPLRLLQDGANAGTTRWTIDSKWANRIPVLAGYSIFTTGVDGTGAYRGHDKQLQWRVTGRFDATPPVAAGDTLYVSGGDAVHAYKLGGGTGVGQLRVGTKRWSHKLEGGAVKGLAVGDGALFAAGDPDPSLVCLEPA